MSAGTPIEVTVADAEVMVRSTAWAKDGTGRGSAQAGDPADDHSYWLTINDIIERANDTGADTVQVDWPAGQDYPNSVFVDRHKSMADDEIGYTIANVQVG